MIDKGLLNKLEVQRLHWMYASKAIGAWHLQCAADVLPLEACVLFSSVGSGLANVGQANYAAGNACLDAHARWRRTHGLTACSLQWPLVDGAGMGATAFAPVIERQVAVAGMSAISFAEYAACLSARLARDAGLALSVQLLHISDVPGLLMDLADASQARFGELAFFESVNSPVEPIFATHGAGIAEGSAFAVSLVGLAPLQRRMHVEDAVLRVVRDLTGASSTSLTVETPLMEAGVDSLAATEVSSRLRLLTGIALSPTIVFEQPTPRAIAVHLLEQVVDSEAPEPDSGIQVPMRLMSTTLSDSLTGIGLDAFLVHFIDEGYDELSFLYNVSIADLLELVKDIGMNEEQAKRFMLSDVLVERGTTSLPPSPPPTPPSLPRPVATDVIARALRAHGLALYAKYADLLLPMVDSLDRESMTAVLTETLHMKRGHINQFLSCIWCGPGSSNSPVNFWKQESFQSGLKLSNHDKPLPARATPDNGGWASLAIAELEGRWPGMLVSEAACARLQAAAGDAMRSVPSMRWVLEEAVLDAGVLGATQVACVRYGGFVAGDRQSGGGQFLGGQEPRLHDLANRPSSTKGTLAPEFGGDYASG
jgi:hypothetical protein